VDVGRRLDGAKESREALDQRVLRVAEIGLGEGGLDLAEDPLLFAAQERPEELVLAREAGVNDRLRDTGGIRDRRHRGALVAVLEEKLERRVENLRPASLGAEVRGALAVRGV